MKATKLVYDVKTKSTQEVEFDFTPQNPRLTEIPERQMEIRSELQQTDYKAIKYAEGQYTDEAYAEIKAHRQALRDEYNALEDELSKIK